MSWSLKDAVDIASVVTAAATAVLVVISICAARIAIRTIKAQQEAAAKDIYRDYLKLAFDNPEFASPHELINPSSLNQNERYRWFVAFMLNSCDEIAQRKSNEKGWRKTIREDLLSHKNYLRSPEFLADGGWGLYSGELNGIADEVVK